MINAVGREIPEEVLKATGKEAFKGAYAFDNHEYKKAAPKAHAMMDPNRSKIVENIHEALVKCEIKDGMTISFHHHFREGDYVGYGRDPQDGYQGHHHLRKLPW